MIVEYTRNKDGFNQRGGYNQRDGLYFKLDIFTMASNREWLQLERWLNLERIRYIDWFDYTADIYVMNFWTNEWKLMKKDAIKDIEYCSVTTYYEKDGKM